MSSRYFKVPIHVKPWVKKYIVANYGDIMLISLKDHRSMVLYSFLQKKSIPFRDKRGAMDRRFTELTASFPLLLQKRDQYKHGLVIENQNHVLINQFFEQEMLTMIFHQCEAYRKAKLPITSAIDDFCTQYDIELDKDISLEATLKAEYRYRQSKKNFKKDRAILSTC